MVLACCMFKLQRLIVQVLLKPKPYVQELLENSLSESASE